MDLDVFGWLADWYGCGQYRVGMPLWALRDHGYRVMVAERMPPELIASRDVFAKPVVIIGQRVVRTDASGIWQRLALAGRHRLVFEVDDDLTSIDPRSNPAGAELYSAPEPVTNLRRNVEVADAVTVTTPRLAEILGQWNPNVHILPNCIAEDLLKLPRKVTDNGKVTIGWGGSFTHLMDFDVAGAQIRRFITRNPHTEFHCIGTDFTGYLKIPQAQSRFSEWDSNFDVYYRKIDFDIGIAPLAPHVFNKSKSFIKALEYAALGIPAVVSDGPTYGDFVQHGQTGFLVKRDYEWGQYLRALTEDTAMREEMGRNAQALAAQYTIQGNAWRWRDAYGLKPKETHKEAVA